MKKILFIIPCVPYPLTSGGSQAFFNMVDYLRHNISVSVLFQINLDDEKKVEALNLRWPDVEFHVFLKEEEVKIKKIPLVRNPFYYKWLKKVKSSVERKMKRQVLIPKNTSTGLKKDIDLMREKSVLSSSASNQFSDKYIDYVSLIAHSGFDIIQVEFFELITLGYILPKNVETIFVHHELRYIRNENEMALFKNIRPMDNMNYFIAKNFERSALETFRHVIVLTELDRELLSKFLEREDHIYISPAVVQLKVDTHRNFVACTQRRFTFIGYGGHIPNLDAINWFCKEIAPCLRMRGFEFVLQVAGLGYEEYTAELMTCCPEVQFLGFVERLDTFLQGSIAVVPIRIGSGMRMKILDVATLKVPFITTSKGLEGLNFTHHEECLIADESENFADEMIRLAGDLKYQELLANQAQDKLKRLYNAQELLERRLSIYKSILES